MSFLAINAATHVIPKEWSTRRFKSLFTVVDDRVGEDPVDRLSLSSQGHVYRREGAGDRQMASDATVARSLRVLPDQLVINPMWLTGGSVAISDKAGAVSPDYRVFAPSDSIVPRYAHHLLRSRPYMDQYQLFVRANTTFDRRVQQADIDAMPVLLPEMAAQRRIADFLDDRIGRIDRITAARGDQIELLHDQQAARIRCGVAGLKEGEQGDRMPEIPWVSMVSPTAVPVALARVLVLQRGVDLTEEERVPGTALVVTTAGVVGTHERAIAPGPGVVIGRYGSVGSVHWVNGPFWPHNTTLYVKDTLGNDLRWVYYLLRSFPYDAMQARAAIPGVNRNDMATELVPWIPVDQQRSSAEWLDDRVADHAKQVEQCARSIDLLSEYKTSLITAAVTGELDVATVGSGILG